MNYTDPTHYDELHLVMLTTDTSQETLLFYLNRPFESFVLNHQDFMELTRAVDGIEESGFGAMSMESFHRQLHMSDGATAYVNNDHDLVIMATPDGTEGMVIKFELEPHITNPTRVICDLACLLGVFFSVDDAQNYISGMVDQKVPLSLQTLHEQRYPGGYIDNNAHTRLPMNAGSAKELVTS